jgi:hypothetical protein
MKVCNSIYICFNWMRYHPYFRAYRTRNISRQISQDDTDKGILCFFKVYLLSIIFTLSFSHIEQQTEPTTTAPSNLENEGKIISFFINYTKDNQLKICCTGYLSQRSSYKLQCRRSWEDVDTIVKAYGKKHGFTAIKK